MSERTMYRCFGDNVDMSDDDGQDVIFTTAAAARKWAMRKLEDHGIFMITELAVDP